ncbi:MAG TPA: trypsin-like peptidase domain-containing protein [Anaerolineaceae bacterium]|nr:trypsin-like peptidase domain-containing protein [Anaerolineaceae bacterium]
MKKKTLVILIAAALVILAGCSFTQALSPFLGGTTDITATIPPATDQATPSTGTTTAQTMNADVMTVVQNTFQKIYESVNPSVVNIQVLENYGWTTISGEGSGFVWNEEGYIVTNNHVVENASEITIVFSDGTTSTASVVGTDPQSDLAVVKVNPKGLSLTPVELGDSHQVKVGDLVIAIGNPYGLAGTMTQGIVSALSRSLTVDESSMFSRTNYTIPDIIQTDAAINPGNSGGVLVNVNGEVIGVTAAIQSSTDSNAGIGFVIPSHIVERVIPILIEDGEYAHPSLGLSGTTLTYALAEEMGLDPETKGILITTINPGGAADQAGLNGSYQQMVAPGRLSITYGDVIIAVDDQPVRSYEDLVSYIFNQTEVGQKIHLTVLRDGKETQVDVVLQGN